ncbi:1,6-anhydro-N-acetylmuramyl-L-alanine amidase AmpD [Dasania marina]|uniref:1,6-anhydro-N-acetylmuramyl-L-alanine amidase AmpD n=1 Tax=Dasania marina TaxID=471499 RepID=UPI00036EFC62
MIPPNKNRELHLSTPKCQGHWLAETATCRHNPSPNYNARPVPQTISLLVIHNISLPAGEFATPYVEQLFTNCLDCQAHPSFHDLERVQVSAHLFINRAGEVCQFVPFDQRAWHAGQSSFAGVVNCNDYSVGIELEGADDIAYTQAQYEKLAELSRYLQAHYPAITKDRITGHSTIAPGRKTDPGPAFDWPYFYQLLELS